ncbi:hypothetical protein C8F01DRAFT_1224698 [Mycena amicta]|nr:hypothetical protein C8F01DRAFT_1224698 [Mycena amicta]
MSLLRLIPRLTLFSGANCSLCDVCSPPQGLKLPSQSHKLAKIELNRVRQTRQFDLTLIDINAPENASWKKKYVYWIPALHLEGQEIAKGRWDAKDVTKALEEWDQARKTETDGTLENIQDEDILRYVSEPHPTYYGVWEPSGIYERYEIDTTTDEVYPIGAPPPPILDPYEANRPRCFNCSETTHVLSACPYPLDKAVVALSRQMHEFKRQQEDGNDTTPRSLRELAERLERVSWTSTFVPGRVGPELRKALRWGQWGRQEEGDDHDDDGNGYEWLSNMAFWGYPPGWVSATDPRERMRARIMREQDPSSDDAEHEDEGDDMMKIWGESGEEDVVLSMPDGVQREKSATVSDGQPTGTPLVRHWARYPRAYFAWECLTVYNGVLLSQRDANLPPTPPPPPQFAPPPLPPPPPSLPPPPLPPAPQFEDGEEEMDLSD